MAKILIVEDSPHIRTLIEDCLQGFVKQGVKIYSSDNGLEGLALIKQEKPDLVFLDIMLPGMNGYEVCAVVKKDPELKGAFIILLSAKVQELDLKKGSDMGADLYLTKPFRVRDLIDKTAGILGIHPN